MLTVDDIFLFMPIIINLKSVAFYHLHLSFTLNHLFDSSLVNAIFFEVLSYVQFMGENRTTQIANKSN